MGDEIRITVIATGFEDMAQKRQGIPNITRMGGHRREDLSMPAYLRNKEKSAESANVVKLGTIDDENIDLQSPTFLRRQAD
jgi:cell division GTPase FtsZ